MEDKQLEEIAKEEHLADEVISMFKYHIFGTITKEWQELVYQVINNLQQENTQLKQEKEETIENLRQFLEEWDAEDYVYKSIKLIYDKLKGDKE